MNRLSLCTASAVAVAFATSAHGAILNASYNAAVKSQTLTGYVANSADAGTTLDNTFVANLDWASWGGGTTVGTGPLAADVRAGGAGIDKTFELTGQLNPLATGEVLDTGSIGNLNWSWSDGVPDLSGSVAGGTAGLRIRNRQGSGGTGSIVFEFAADPTGAPRAATLLGLFATGSNPFDVVVSQGTDSVTVLDDSTGAEGLFTFEYDGTDALTVSLIGNLRPNGADMGATTVARGFAATLSSTVAPVIPEPTSAVAVAAAGLCLLRRRRA